MVLTWCPWACNQITCQWARSMGSSVCRWRCSSSSTDKCWVMCNCLILPLYTRFWYEGVPDWVWQRSDPHTHLLGHLGRCRHQNQPWKVAHEPRKVRYRNRTYPPLRGDRNAARQAALTDLGAANELPTDEAAGSDPPLDHIAGTPAPPGKTARRHQRLDAS